MIHAETTGKLRETVVPVVLCFDRQNPASLESSSILLINQSYDDEPINSWRLPQGGVDPNEILIEAGVRELREELGIDLSSCVNPMVHETIFSSPASKKEYHPVTFVSDGPRHRSGLLVRPNPLENVRAAWWAPLSMLSEILNPLKPDTRLRTAQIAINAVRQIIPKNTL